MKNIINLTLLSLVSMTFLACNKTNSRDAEVAAIHEEIATVEKNTEELRVENGETGLRATPPESTYSNEFLTSFCEIVGKNKKTQEILPLLSPIGSTAKTLTLISQISNALTDCELIEAKFYDHPFDLAEYKTDKGFVYIQVTYDKNYKVKSLIPLVFKDQVEFKMNKVVTRDQVPLTTYVIYKKGLTDKVGSIFLRTPYMVYGSYVSYAQLALYYNKALVIQANRGSHSSEGEFKWLEKRNIQDSYDSIDWISQQPFSNGKVVAYGVSYDGFDALASAASNHPALKSVIACSAPANAATDSFTASRFVENGIFSYVTTDRKEESLEKINDIWEFVQTDISKQSRLKMDDILLGFNSTEWNETSEAIDNLNHPYWNDRQLLDELNLANMPITHIAGLKRDQDGRDTLLAFNSIQKNSSFKDQNYLVLHKDGHGCGDAFKLDVYNDMIALTDSDSSKVDLSKHKKYSRYNVKSNDFAFADDELDLPITSSTIEFPTSTDVTDYGYLKSADPNLYEKMLVLDVTEEMTLNGAPTMKLYYKASAPEIPLHVYFLFTDPQGKAIENTSGWRTGFVSQKLNTVDSVDLTFPLVNAKVPAGSKLQVYLTTRDKRVFYRQPLIRDQFLTVGLFQPSIEIINDGAQKSVINLPVEVKNPILTNLPSAI